MTCLLSIIIPTLNEEKRLADALAYLDTLKGNIEVSV